MTDETVTVELRLSAAVATAVGDRISRVAEYRHWRN